MKKVFRSFFILILLTCYFSIHCFAINQQDFNAGYDYGYNDGFKDATSQDTVNYYFDEGYSKGYNEGLNSANNETSRMSQDIFNKSYNNGFKDGYISGESSGKRIQRMESNDQLLNKDKEISKLKSVIEEKNDDYNLVINDYNRLLVGFYIILTLFLLSLLTISWTFIRKYLHNRKAMSQEKRKERIKLEKQQVNMRMSSSPRKVNWLEFCMNWRYPLGAIISLISIIVNYLEYDIVSLFINSPILTVSACIFDLTLLAIIVLAAINVRRLTIFGFKINRILLILEPISFSFSSAFKQNSITSWLLVVTFATVFAILNIIYFEHRRYLFDQNAPYPCEVNNKFITDDKQ